MPGKSSPHPKNRGGEPIRIARTKTLAGDIFYNGYDPTEATVDSVVVEVDDDPFGNPKSTFPDHFKFSVELKPDHYIDPAAVILFAGLSHNSLNLTERSVFNGMPGCACDPPATCLEHCTCNAKPILEEKGGKLKYSEGRFRLIHCNCGRHRVGDPKQGHGQRGARCRTHHCCVIEPQKRCCTKYYTFGNDADSERVVQTRPHNHGGSVGSSKGRDDQDFRPGCT